MSAALLLNELLQVLSGAEVKNAIGLKSVKLYGGEFSGSDIDKSTYNCPAVLVSCLGHRPLRDGEKPKLSCQNERRARFVAFISTSHKKSARACMMQGLQIAECLEVQLRQHSFEHGTRPDEFDCENLYGPAVARHKQALWQLTWWQAIEAPNCVEPQLYDWLTTEIDTDLTPADESDEPQMQALVDMTQPAN